MLSLKLKSYLVVLAGVTSLFFLMNCRAVPSGNPSSSALVWEDPRIWNKRYTERTKYELMFGEFAQHSMIRGGMWEKKSDQLSVSLNTSLDLNKPMEVTVVNLSKNVSYKILLHKDLFLKYFGERYTSFYINYNELIGVCNPLKAMTFIKNGNVESAVNVFFNDNDNKNSKIIHEFFEALKDAANVLYLPNFSIFVANTIKLKKLDGSIQVNDDATKVNTEKFRGTNKKDKSVCIVSVNKNLHGDILSFKYNDYSESKNYFSLITALGFIPLPIPLMEDYENITRTIDVNTKYTGDREFRSNPGIKGEVNYQLEESIDLRRSGKINEYYNKTASLNLCMTAKTATYKEKENFGGRGCFTLRYYHWSSITATCENLVKAVD